MKIYSCVSKDTVLTDLTPSTEFELQAELYGKLKKHGYIVRGEYIMPRMKDCRFDIVVFHRKKAIAIIECKKAEHLEDLAQSFKYRQCSVPVILFNSMSEYVELTTALDSLKKDAPIDFDKQPEEFPEAPPIAHRRLQHLLYVLRTTAAAAFDARQVYKKETNLLWEIETTAENFINRISSLNDFPLIDKFSSEYFVKYNKKTDLNEPNTPTNQIKNTGTILDPEELRRERQAAKEAMDRLIAESETKQ